jgi:hypothetical protein
LPLQQSVFLYDTHAKFFAIVNSNEITLEIIASRRTGYISDGNRNAKGLLTSADNGEHIEIFFREDSRVKM